MRVRNTPDCPKLQPVGARQTGDRGSFHIDHRSPVGLGQTSFLVHGGYRGRCGEHNVVLFRSWRVGEEPFPGPHIDHNAGLQGLARPKQWQASPGKPHGEQRVNAAFSERGCYAGCCPPVSHAGSDDNGARYPVEMNTLRAECGISGYTRHQFGYLAWQRRYEGQAAHGSLGGAGA